MEKRWWPWAEIDRQRQPVQDVYATLYSIYQKQQRLGEQYEVVLGLGLLAWDAPGGQQILRHLLTAQTSLSFDSARGIVAVGPAGEGSRLTLEQDMLDASFQPNPEVLQALESQIDEIGDDIWDGGKAEEILKSWVHSVSPRGRFDDTLEPPKVHSDPHVHLAPALVLRRRTERSFERAFTEIVRQLNDNAAVPPGVARFVEVIEDGVVQDQEQWSEAKESGVIPTEPYFPLEANDAQRKIVERLATSQGVLVQGPPGTGKSHTIVNLVCHLLATGKRVLVTSHAPRALRVLRGYIKEHVPEIAPLAVVLLGDDRESLQVLEDSVQGITDRHSQWSEEENHQKIANLDKDLGRARAKEQANFNELRALREVEVFVHPPCFGDYKGTLQKIAVRIRKEAAEFDWFHDQPAEDVAPPLTENELVELLELVREDHLDSQAAKSYETVDLEQLVAKQEIVNLFRTEAESKQRFETVASATNHPDYPVLVSAPPETCRVIKERLGKLLRDADAICRDIHQWASKAVREILGDHDHAWRELLEATKLQLLTLEPRVREAEKLPVSGLGDRDRRAVRADAEELLSHLESGGRLGWRFLRKTIVKQREYLFEIRAGGRRCYNVRALRSLILRLGVEEELTSLRDRWEYQPYGDDQGRALPLQVQDYAALCQPLQAALTLHDEKIHIQKLIASIPELSDPTWHDLKSLKSLLAAIDAVEQEHALAAASKAVESSVPCLEEMSEVKQLDPALADLLASIRQRDLDQYAMSYDKLIANNKARGALKRRRQLLEQLREGAPSFAEAIRRDGRDPVWTQHVKRFSQAWNWARARQWIRRMSQPDAERKLRLSLDTGRIRKCLASAAAERAWGHCFRRMTEHQRQHLVAWSKAMKNIGKGTGKHAPKHRRAAREHMEQCRQAIPAWIMPLYRVAETIQPGSDIFDVVIIDEASQSGPEALLLTYLARKIVVVGDDKQIAPVSFVRGDDVEVLRRRYIAELPHNDQYGIDNSFFDLAEIRYGGRIPLREHFRCMPEIIQFSNKNFYRAQPLIPLRQYAGDRLEPVVVTTYVKDGYLEGKGSKVVNRPEANALVKQIVDCSRDSAFSKKSFGVISLLGHHQARLIEQLLLKKLGPEEMEHHRIVCGDAHHFQGDERDVMFLSLVAAPTGDRSIRALSDQKAERRFNVAASRARDQMWLFHSATCQDLSDNCLRRKLLEYCLDPTAEQPSPLEISLDQLSQLANTPDRNTTPLPVPFESWFEIDVFLRISDKGYRIVPQYEVNGRRIDLLVVGNERRVAVECDGEYWHSPDRYIEDGRRQRTLERCGLVFWRVRGSCFELDPEEALQELWETLHQNNIYPERSRDSGDSERFAEDSEQERGRVIECEAARSGEPKREREQKMDLGDSSSPDRRQSGPQGTAIGRSDPESGKILFKVAYDSWTAETLPDPRGASSASVSRGLVAIVEREGPILSQRAYRLFAKAAGIHKVGTAVQEGLDRGRKLALQDRLLSQRIEIDITEHQQSVLWKVGTPSIVVRARGPRLFQEVPASEVATVLDRLRQKDPMADQENLFRALLEHYDITKLGRGIRMRLELIDQHLRELAAGG